MSCPQADSVFPPGKWAVCLRSLYFQYGMGQKVGVAWDLPQGDPEKDMGLEDTKLVKEHKVSDTRAWCQSFQNVTPDWQDQGKQQTS